MLRPCVCPSVCLSQAGVLSERLYTCYHANNALRRPGDSSFLKPKLLVKFRWDHCQWRRQVEVGRYLPRTLNSAQTLYRRKFVSVRHDSPRRRRCTGGAICSVVSYVNSVRSCTGFVYFITPMASLRSRSRCLKWKFVMILSTFSTRSVQFSRGDNVSGHRRETDSCPPNNFPSNISPTLLG